MELFDVNIGERVVVSDFYYLETKVSAITKLNDGRVLIKLDWGVHGTSHVYLHDRNNTWCKYKDYKFLN